MNPWISAARPKTLWAAVAPVLIGCAMAEGDGVFHAPSAVAALLASLLIQIGTNFWNDYADFVRGTDTKDRVGPTRATAAGLISPQAMRNAALVVFALSGLCAVYLFPRAGWPILVIGAASIASGIAYTSGSMALAYTGMADLFAFTFFGPVAVAGTYYVQGLTWPPEVIVAGIAPGLLSVAILTVNNLRDIETDAKAGRKTLAVRFGRRFARTEYIVAIVGASLVPFWTIQLAQQGANAVVAFLIFPAALPAIRSVCKKSGAELNPSLAYTAILLLVYSVLFSVGWTK